MESDYTQILLRDLNPRSMSDVVLAKASYVEGIFRGAALASAGVCVKGSSISPGKTNDGRTVVIAA
jgi:hypothetical protein